MNIIYQTVIDSEGKPAAALIPWEEFIRLQEFFRDEEVIAEEAEALREAREDRRSGNNEAFTDLADLKVQLSL